MQEEFQTSYFQQLSVPNPLQQRCLKPPRSIFPLIQLPAFSFSDQQSPLLTALKQVAFSPQKNKIRNISISPKKKVIGSAKTKFLVEQTEIKTLFSNHIYLYSKRLSKGSNKNFCNIKVFPQESHDHKLIPNNIEDFFKNQSKKQNLSFQSRFQSGNLAMVEKSRLFQNQYYLLLTKDFNTAQCTQWFFFRVLNKIKTKSTFHILNFSKNYSSFQYGMKVCIATKSNNYTWIRGGQNIQYKQTNLKSGHKYLYSLSFTFGFKQNQDITYFAYSYPYTFSRLDKFLFKLQDLYPNILKRRSIGESLGGNSIDMITITNFKSSSNDKKLVLITARVHPGETPSSFVMQGIINQLIETSKQMQNAREKFIFKLIPMINPDGVINGNYRCSLSGNDLNRIWDKCQKDKFPEIYSIKKMIKSSNKPFLFIDLHAHSKKKGAFMYGCSIKNNPFLCRQIPFLLWKNINEFNYFQCNFSTSSRQREGTSRINLYKQFGVNLSYTMQHSFCGPLKTRNHFTTFNFNNIGSKLILTIQKFYGRRNKRNSNEAQINNLLKQLYQNKQFAKVGQGEDNDSSSDSQLDAKFQVDAEQNIKYKKNLQRLRPTQRINFKQMNQNQVKTPRQDFSNNFILTRASSFREKVSSQIKISKKRNCYDALSKIGFDTNDYFKGSEELKPDSPDRNRDCYTSLKKQNQENVMSKKIIKPSIVRYAEEQINNLTDLFLPSVTSSSYKKYNKPKTQNKNIVRVGRTFLENAGILKQQIRSTLKRKIQWKTPSKGLLGN